jgi:hypothetical protein
MLLSFLSAILNPGLVAIPRGAYLVIVFLIPCLRCFGKHADSVLGKWLLTRNPIMMYVFAGYFGINGWSPGSSQTFGLFIALWAYNFRLCRDGPWKYISERWRLWSANFQLRIINKVGNMSYGIAYVYDRFGYRGYVCPANYLWGVVGVKMFGYFKIPEGLSAGVLYLGAGAFMVHLLGKLRPGILPQLFRPEEKIIDATVCWKAAWLSVCEMFIFGCLCEVFRGALFAIAEKAIYVGVRIGQLRRWRSRRADGKV